ncbi:hypothetical protein [Neisseria sp.]|uniref:hypothetical protein n=1 Tax=Neisseria sp. TaxID=192066 RepID=UPI00359F6460
MAIVKKQTAQTVKLMPPNAGRPVIVRLPPESRELTAGEIALARIIYKDSIPLTKSELYVADCSECPTIRTMP